MRTGEVHAAIAAGELGEVLPATRTAWRDGKISSGAVRIMRSARVPGFDDELAAVESELLAAALKKDFWSLGRMAQHFKRCARRDGDRPPEKDGLRASMVGDRLALDADIGGLNAETISPRPSMRSPIGRPRVMTGAWRNVKPMVSPGCAGSRWVQTKTG